MLSDGNDRESNWTRNVRGSTPGLDATPGSSDTSINPIKTHYENVSDKTCVTADLPAFAHCHCRWKNIGRYRRYRTAQHSTGAKKMQFYK